MLKRKKCKAEIAAFLFLACFCSTLLIESAWAHPGQQEIWYKFLNSGFNLPATAGPDWVMKDAPRAYVYIGQDSFTIDNWLAPRTEGAHSNPV